MLHEQILSTPEYTELGKAQIQESVNRLLRSETRLTAFNHRAFLASLAHLTSSKRDTLQARIRQTRITAE